MAEEATTEPLELTEREIAIAQGLDPDAVEDSDGEVTEDVTPDPAPQARQDAETGGDKEVATGAWIDDDARELAKSYGLSDDELSAFASPEEFERAAALIDKKFADAAKQSDESPAGAKADSEKPAAKPAFEKIDPQAYIDAGYGEEEVKLAKMLRATQDKLEQIETERTGERQAAQEAQQQHIYHANLSAFHDLMDQESDLFGKSVDENGDPVKLGDEEVARREKVWNASVQIVMGAAKLAEQRGQQPEAITWPVLVKRAKALALGDELQSRERDRISNRVRTQASRRRPAPGGLKAAKAAKHSGGEQADDMDAIANDPRVVSVWNKYQEENGAA